MYLRDFLHYPNAKARVVNKHTYSTQFHSKIHGVSGAVTTVYGWIYGYL